MYTTEIGKCYKQDSPHPPTSTHAAALVHQYILAFWGLSDSQSLHSSAFLCPVTHSLVQFVK